MLESKSESPSAPKTEEVIRNCLSCGREFVDPDIRRIVCKDCGKDWYKNKKVFHCVNCGDSINRNDIIGSMTASEWSALKAIFCHTCYGNIQDDDAYARLMRHRILSPPYGYMFHTVVHANDTAEVGGMLLGWSKDEKFRKMVKQSSLRSMLQELRKNGFSTPFKSKSRRQ